MTEFKLPKLQPHITVPNHATKIVNELSVLSENSPDDALETNSIVRKSIVKFF